MNYSQISNSINKVPRSKACNEFVKRVKFMQIVYRHTAFKVRGNFRRLFIMIRGNFENF